MDYVWLGNNKFPTLVAITEEEQQRGLQGTTWPPPVMTFPFADSGIRKFWMNKTAVPLDLVFCRDNKIISIAQGRPLSLDFIGPNIPIDLVVELPLGLAKQAGIKIGESVKIQYSIYTVAKQCQIALTKL